jgi:hypothetical protein
MGRRRWRTAFPAGAESRTRGYCSEPGMGCCVCRVRHSPGSIAVGKEGCCAHQASAAAFYPQNHASCKHHHLPYLARRWRQLVDGGKAGAHRRCCSLHLLLFRGRSSNPPAPVRVVFLDCLAFPLRLLTLAHRPCLAYPPFLRFAASQAGIPPSLHPFHPIVP